jgi:hypothetical protein
MMRAADCWRLSKRSSWTQAISKVDSFYTKTELLANDLSPISAYFRVRVGVGKGWDAAGTDCLDRTQFGARFVNYIPTHLSRKEAELADSFSCNSEEGLEGRSGMHSAWALRTAPWAISYILEELNARQS